MFFRKETKPLPLRRVPYLHASSWVKFRRLLGQIQNLRGRVWTFRGKVELFLCQETHSQTFFWKRNVMGSRFPLHQQLITDTLHVATVSNTPHVKIHPGSLAAVRFNSR